MSHFKRIPNSVHYLAGRLRAWTRPTILVPMVIFCAGGLLLWEVSVNPESIGRDEGEEVADLNPTDRDGGISSEDSAIAAEIDTVPFLTNQLHNSSVNAGLLNSPVLRTKGLFDEVRDRRLGSAQSSPAPKPSSANTYQALPNSEISPVSVSANNNLFNSAGLTNSTPSEGALGDSTYSVDSTSLFTTNSPNAEKLKASSLGISALQIAMKEGKNGAKEQGIGAAEESSPCSLPSNFCPRLSLPDSAANNSANYPFKANEAQTLSTNQPQFSSLPVTSSESLPGLNPNIPNTTLTSQTNNPYQNNQSNNPYQTNLSGAGLLPEIQPVAPAAPIATVPEIVSGVSNNSGQSSFPTPIQATKVIDSGVANSGNVGFPIVSPAGSNLGVPTNSQVNQALPPTGQVTTSVPEPLPIPGRYIGEGKIKTFANP